ncbi:Protein YdcF [Cyphellophora attinorum]|uniref:Protein YdcF n=1 Tax=Cyphellophora attinorum TaxID=1664694 RepID=A0A0N1H4N5_9EURO|nr:Protein YdcF [Phialophora attinorum]KPI36334.1 Protein YdcF [Phialophora attinorum]
MSNLEASHINSINAIANFLAHVEIPSLSSYKSQIDVIVLCGNSILPIADHVFSALEANPRLVKCLVICGGIGHSTGYLYEAVGAHAKYRSRADDIQGLPEARVLELIRTKFYDVAKVSGSGLKVIIEDQSTNCGANAIETRRVLDAAGITSPEQIVIVQDPTMSLRTRAAFQKVYADHTDPPRFETCPTFIPKLTVSDSGEVQYDIAGPDPKDYGRRTGSWISLWARSHGCGTYLKAMVLVARVSSFTLTSQMRSSRHLRIWRALWSTEDDLLPV